MRCEERFYEIYGKEPTGISFVKCVVNNNSMRVWRYRRRTDRYQQSNAPCRKGCERLNGHCAGR